MFNRIWKERVRKLENQVVILQNQIAPLRCAAGKHEWQALNTENIDPRNPPYLRCVHCYLVPEKKP